MRKIKYKKGRKVIPSSLEYTGSYKETKTELQLFVYDSNDLTEFNNITVEDLKNHLNFPKINWLNIHGLNDIEVLKKVANVLKFDPFVLNDILNTTGRTKLEEHHDLLFFKIKSILPIENTDNLKLEQISFVLKDGLLVSFQEKRSDFFSHIRERLRTHAGIVRDKKADYLLYLLLDAVMENFYITIENEEDNIESLIDQSKVSSSPFILELIEKHRDNFNFLKRSIIPLRESLYSIKSIKDDNVFNGIEHENYSFFSRLHQKCMELLDQIDYDTTNLESASSFYFSAQNHKMNEIMKTLTIVSSIFIPLTFIVGVYGMNFHNMPELRNPNGYFYVIGIMALIMIVMVFYFKWRKWF